MVNLGIVDAAVHAVQMHESLTHGHLHFIIFPAIISPPSLNRFSPIPIPFIPIFFLPTKPTSLTSSLTARSPLIYLQSYPSSRYLFLSLSHHLPILPSCFIKPITIPYFHPPIRIKPMPRTFAWPCMATQTLANVSTNPFLITTFHHPSHASSHSIISVIPCVQGSHANTATLKPISLTSFFIVPTHLFFFFYPTQPHNLSALLKKFIHGARVVQSLLVETHSTQLSIMANFLCLVGQTMLAYFLDSVWV